MVKRLKRRLFFYSLSEFSLADRSMGGNVIIFGVDINSSVHNL